MCWVKKKHTHTNKTWSFKFMSLFYSVYWRTGWFFHGLEFVKFHRADLFLHMGVVEAFVRQKEEERT
jgi:hypothetical protein